MNRLAGTLLLICQLLMLWEATEHVAINAILGGVAGLWLIVPERFRLPNVWLVGVPGLVTLGFVAGLQNTFPIQLTPGQDIWSLRIAVWGLCIQSAHLLSRRFHAVSMVAFGMGTICSLSILDFQGYASFSIGWALLAGAFAVACLQEPMDWRTIWSRGHTQRDPHSGGAGLWVTLIAIVIGGTLLSTLISQQMPVVRRWMASQLSISSRATIRREVGFSTGGWIGAVARTKETDPLALVLTVESDQAPGYLKARAYDSFTGTRWLPMRPEMRVDAQQPGVGAPVRGRRLFPLLPADGPWRKFTVENAEELRGLFFIPGDTAYFSIGGDRLIMGRNQDILRAVPSLRYTAYVGRTAETEPPTDPRLTTVPPNFDPRVGDMAQQIAGGAMSDTQTISAISTHLRTVFEYSLDSFEVPDGVDPTSYFLLNRKPAHCEYFATGTVALLRHFDIPCRYVIGFLTTEMEDDSTWKARNQDAHAWVEAYDRNRKRWVTVDSTPGSGLASDRSLASANSTGSVLDANDDLQANTWWRRTIDLLKHPLTIAVMLCCLIVLGSTLSRMTWRRLDHLAKQRRWLDRRLRRRGLKRMPSETLHQFASRIVNAGRDDPWLLKAAQWQREYATVRFGSVAPDSLTDPRQWRSQR